MLVLCWANAADKKPASGQRFLVLDVSRDVLEIHILCFLLETSITFNVSGFSLTFKAKIFSIILYDYYHNYNATNILHVITTIPSITDCCEST